MPRTPRPRHAGAAVTLALALVAALAVTPSVPAQRSPRSTSSTRSPERRRRPPFPRGTAVDDVAADGPREVVVEQVVSGTRKLAATGSGAALLAAVAAGLIATGAAVVTLRHQVRGTTHAGGDARRSYGTLPTPRGGLTGRHRKEEP